MRQRNVGDRQQIFTNNTCLEGVITNISVIDEGEQKGVLESYSLDNYGITQDFFYPDSENLNERVERRRSLSMIPPEYVYKKAAQFDWTLYGEEMTPQKKIANAFIVKFSEFRKQGRGLYIFSETKGSGKTMLACCLANEIMDRVDTSVKFITAPEYVELIKEKNESSKEIVKSIKECGLLIFDDIGIESGKQGWIDEAIFYLIDYRDKHMLSTIYTSNFGMESLPGDERSIDRIIGHSVPLKMPEYSVRRNRAKEKTGNFLKEVLD